MRCNNCNKKNTPNAKFCKYCGSPIQQTVYKTCINGHNYDSSLDECPFCPPKGYPNSIGELDNQKTVLDSSPPTIDKTLSDDDKTIVDNSAQTIKHSFTIGDEDKTVLITDSNPESVLTLRKLVGWLVTFDLNPNGIDFKLFEGRNTIGRSSKNDIIIQDKSVSEKHCTILFRNGKFLISDELSTNGTYVNNELIEDKAYLNDNDIIKLGRINLKFKMI